MFASALEQSSLISASAIQASDGDAKLKDGSLVAYIVFPPDFSSRAQAGTIPPEVHLQGSQPGTSGPVLQAPPPALSSVAAGGPGARRPFVPRIRYLYGGRGFCSPAHSGGGVLWP